MTLEVSFGALAGLALVLVVCFVLPVALFSLLYRYADGSAKMFALGAAAFFGVKFVLELPLSIILDRFGPDGAKNVFFCFYTLLFCPLAFVAVNYAVLRRYGKKITTTGQSLMAAAGYTGLQNIVETGAVGVMYFLTLLRIRSTGSYVVVSESDYISMSDKVSGSDVVTDRIFAEMRQLCDAPASYYVQLALERIGILLAYSAVLVLIWLAVRKRAGLPLLGAALGLRLLTGIPSVLTQMGVFGNAWFAGLTVVGMLAVVIGWTAFLWRRFIDAPDVSEETETADSPEEDGE